MDQIACKKIIGIIFGLLAIAIIALPASGHAQENTNPEIIRPADTDLLGNDSASTPTSSASPDLASEKLQTNYYLGKVTAITDDGKIVDPQTKLYGQQVHIALSNGKQIVVENDYVSPNNKYLAGQRVIVMAATDSTGTTYTVIDKYRIPAVTVLVLTFFLLVILLARRKGFMAILGLAASLLIIIKWEIPAILAGHNPLLTSLGVTALIAIVSLYLAHGFSRRTTIAVISTFATLVIAIFVAIWAVHFSKLSGQGSEEAFYVQVSATQNIDLLGLLLGGIVVGALGVLDDITTAQVAIVYELKHANNRLGLEELYRRGLAVGKEHIASLVNTLVLAYVGVALPLLLLLVINNQSQPLWVSLNSEYIMEEVIRAIVGSATLVLAVPIATFLAAYVLDHYPHWFDRKETHSQTDISI